MSVQSTARYAGPFAGNGVTTVFAFAFKVFATTDVVVLQTVTASGAVSNPVNGADYTVQLNADQNANPGGTITFAVAPPATVSFFITSGIPRSQLSSFPNPGPWNPITAESAWDKSMGIIQEIGQAALLFAPGDVASTHVLPSPAARKNSVIGFDATGVMVVNSLAGFALASVVAGQIAFGGAVNMLTQDAALVWDNVSKRQGIGVAVPTVALDVLGTGKFSTSVVTSLVGTDAATVFQIKTGGTARWSVETTGTLDPNADNAVDLGATSNRVRSGFFGTSVVTPLVQAASGAALNIGADGTAKYQIGTGGSFLPVGDNTQNVGSNVARLANIFTPIIDSGTTGSLSAKVNNGELIATFQRTGGIAANSWTIESGSSGSGRVQIYPTGGDANISPTYYSRGAGNHDFFTNVATNVLQFQILHTASANRNITVTGSNGGNPTLGVTAGNLAITPAVLGAGSILSSSPSGGIGYASGSGGTVTQLTNKTTGVTLNTITGQITMNGAALAANAEVQFVLTDSVIDNRDVIILNHSGTGTYGAYAIQGKCASGSATISVRNVSAGSLSEAIVLNYCVMRGFNA